MPPLNVHHNAPPLQPHPIRSPVSPLHILLMLILHKRIALAAARGGFGIENEFEIFDRAVRFHLAKELPFGHLVG